MTTSIRVDRTPGGRVRADLVTGALAPRLVERSALGVRVALVATGALLLAGDHVVVDVEVAPGLSLEVVEVAGTVAHDMRGGAASWRVTARVGEGGSLVWAGLPFVVSAGADVVRSTEREVGGDLRVETRARRPDGAPVLEEVLDLSRRVRDAAVVLDGARCLDQLTVLGRRLRLDGPQVLQLAEEGSLVRSLTAQLHHSTVPAALEAARALVAREPSAQG